MSSLFLILNLKLNIMKKAVFIALVSLLFCVSSVFSQEHLTFKGIPIDGSLTSFTAKMKAKGFDVVFSDPSGKGSIYKGTFAGRSNSLVSAHVSNGVVTSVIVDFPKYSTWSGLEREYLELQAMLTKKYGTPARQSEYFQSPYDNYPSDSEKMTGTKFDYCKYYTIYELDLGQIELYITHEDYECFVMLKYFDKTNYSKKESSAYDDL